MAYTIPVEFTSGARILCLHEVAGLVVHPWDLWYESPGRGSEPRAVPYCFCHARMRLYLHASAQELFVAQPPAGPVRMLERRDPEQAVPQEEGPG